MSDALSLCLIQALDSMAEPYEFTVIDAGQAVERIFRQLQCRISHLRFGGSAKRRTAVRKAKS